MNFSLKKLFFGLMLAGIACTVQTAEKKAEPAKLTMAQRAKAKVTRLKKWFSDKMGSTESQEDLTPFESIEERNNIFRAHKQGAEQAAQFLQATLPADLCRIIIAYTQSPDTVKHIYIPMQIQRWINEEYGDYTSKQPSAAILKAKSPVASLWWSNLGYNKKYEQLNVRLYNTHKDKESCIMRFKINKDEPPQKVSAFPFGLHSSQSQDPRYFDTDRFIGDTSIDLSAELPRSATASSQCVIYDARVVDQERTEIEIICSDSYLDIAFKEFILRVKQTPE